MRVPPLKRSYAVLAVLACGRRNPYYSVYTK
jgi:hypothetical protein